MDMNHLHGNHRWCDLIIWDYCGSSVQPLVHYHDVTRRYVALDETSLRYPKLQGRYAVVFQRLLLYNVAILFRTKRSRCLTKFAQKVSPLNLFVNSYNAKALQAELVYFHSSDHKEMSWRWWIANDNSETLPELDPVEHSQGSVQSGSLLWCLLFHCEITLS